MSGLRTSAEALLRVEGLTKRFGGLTAVSDLSLTVAPAEIVGLVGPNGAGKSTTFDLISGYRPATSGELFFAGRKVTGLKSSVISRLGLVRTFQHASFFRELTVFDNVELGLLTTVRDPQARRQRVEAALELLQLDDVAGDMAEALPHGRQRMLSIAIALGPAPRLLCLDEPLTGLNLTEVRVALQAIERIRTEQGAAVLIVDHNMRAMMQICERIIVLNHGQLLAAGTPEEVRSNPDVVAAYLGTEP